MPTLVDAVLPLLKPYEFSLYMLLLRATEFRGGSPHRQTDHQRPSRQGNAVQPGQLLAHHRQAECPCGGWLYRYRRHHAGGHPIPCSPP